MRNNSKKSFSNIYVLLQQRTDEIPSLVSIVKGYAEHEKNVVNELMELRKEALYSQQSYEKKSKHLPKLIATNNRLSNQLERMVISVESTPKNEAGTVYQQLFNRLVVIENTLSDQREFFNRAVSLYNLERNKFPNIIVAFFLRFKALPLLVNIPCVNDQ